MLLFVMTISPAGFVKAQASMHACRYPFMYGASAKAHFLKLDARATMSEGMMASLLGSRSDGSPFLVLNVRRGPELVRDTLTRVRAAMSADALKKPLKVRDAHLSFLCIPGHFGLLLTLTAASVERGCSCFVPPVRLP